MSEYAVALVTCDEAQESDGDLALLTAALRRHGVAAFAASWTRPHDWGGFDAAVLRSTWDYPDDLPRFLDWAEDVAGRTRLLNPLGVVRWNTDKRYLRELHVAGVPVVPTTFVAPGADDWRWPASAEFVVKPAVGAGSRDAARYRADEWPRAAAHVRGLLARGRTVMVQPYVASVDASGETAVVLLEGEFSHALRKGGLLDLDGGFVEGLFAPEDVTAASASAGQLAVAGAAVAAVPGGPPLYARVDLVTDDAGGVRVLELEATEPSLFHRHAPGSADRFAAAIRRRVAAPGPGRPSGAGWPAGDAGG